MDNTTLEGLEHVVDRYSGYVQGLATKLHRQLKLKIELQDLVAYGNIGLIEAWSRYDQQQHATFTTFSYNRIRGAMLDGCRKEGWISRDRSKEAKAARILNGYMESNAEANAAAPEARTLAEALSRVERTVSNAVTVLLVEDIELEQLQSDTALDPLASLERSDLERRLHSAILALEDNERSIVIRHHFRDESLTQIGEDMNLSTSWVSRIHSRALNKIRLTFEQQDTAPPR